jgi:hypothetical protein
MSRDLKGREKRKGFLRRRDNINKGLEVWEDLPNLRLEGKKDRGMEYMVGRTQVK